MQGRHFSLLLFFIIICVSGGVWSLYNAKLTQACILQSSMCGICTASIKKASLHLISSMNVSCNEGPALCV